MGWVRLWIGIAVVVAASFLALAENLHGNSAEPESLVGRFLEPVLLSGAVLGVVAGVAVLLVRRHYRQALLNLSQRLACFRSTSSPLALHSFMGMEPTGEEWQAVHDEIEALANRYRQALDEIVRMRETVETLRNDPGGADAGKGQSSSLAQQTSFLRSSRLIARLTPNLYWMAATALLQRFLGHSMAELNARSFLECVHDDDVSMVTAALQEALREGEGHNITFRVLPSTRQTRHVQMDVLTRFTAEGHPLHLRCHFVDVTDRVQAEKSLRLQSLQLTQANALLRETNAGLKRLKESYRDLYHKAPVLYFSLDPQGHFAACNDTLLGTLGYDRADLLGQFYTRLLTPAGPSGSTKIPASSRGWAKSRRTGPRNRAGSSTSGSGPRRSSMPGDGSFVRAVPRRM